MSNLLSRPMIGIFALGLFGLYPVISSSQVVVNEICWMGGSASANDEWIELYNHTENSVNLDHWQLVSQDNSPKIVLKGIIPAKGFFLLERTDDNTLPGVLADQIYKGALENSGEYLKLLDSQNNLTDEVNASSKWLAGENFTKKTMERKDPGLSGSNPSNWGSSQNPGGTPKKENSSILIDQSPPPSPLASLADSLPDNQDVIENGTSVSAPPGTKSIFGLAAVISFLSSLIVVFLLKRNRT